MRERKRKEQESAEAISGLKNFITRPKSSKDAFLKKCCLQYVLFCYLYLGMYLECQELSILQYCSTIYYIHIYYNHKQQWQGHHLAIVYAPSHFHQNLLPAANLDKDTNNVQIYKHIIMIKYFIFVTCQPAMQQ